MVVVGMEGCGWLGEVFRRSASWQDRPGHPSNAPWLELERVAFSLVLWSNHSPHVLKPPSVPSLSFLWQSPTLPTPWWGGSNTLLISLPIFWVSPFQSILHTVTKLSILKYSFTSSQLSLENNRTSPQLLILPGENNKSFRWCYGYSSVWPSKMYPLLLFNDIPPARYKNLASG